MLALISLQLKRNGDWDVEAQLTTPLLIDRRTGQWFRKAAYMRLYYPTLIRTIEQLSGVRYERKVVEYFFGFHSSRAQYLNDMEGAGAPDDLTALGGQWSEKSSARAGYRRDRIRQILACNAAAAQQMSGPTMPEVMHEVEAALQTQLRTEKSQVRDNAAEAGALVEQRMPPLPANTGANTAIALAYEAQRQSEGLKASFELPTAPVERRRPVELMHRQIALWSLDTRIPVEERMVPQQGKTPYIGQVAAVQEPEEEDFAGEYEVLVAFPTPGASGAYTTEEMAASLIPQCGVSPNTETEDSAPRRPRPSGLTHDKFMGGQKAGQCKLKCALCRAQRQGLAKS